MYTISAWVKILLVSFSSFGLNQRKKGYRKFIKARHELKKKKKWYKHK
jgi:hypothetical protein